MLPIGSSKNDKPIEKKDVSYSLSLSINVPQLIPSSSLSLSLSARALSLFFAFFFLLQAYTDKKKKKRRILFSAASPSLSHKIVFVTNEHKSYNQHRFERQRVLDWCVCVLKKKRKKGINLTGFSFISFSLLFILIQKLYIENKT
jgi:hypothetical protein